MDRQSLPITDTDLDAIRDRAEKQLTRIVGSKDLLQDIFKELSPEEPYRTLPLEVNLFYSIRHATCLYFWFIDWLFIKTGQKEDAFTSPGSEAVKSKQRFSSAYALFVMASYIVNDCKELLKGKDEASLASATPNFKFDLGRSASLDLQAVLAYYHDTLFSDDGKGNRIVRNANDIVSITRDFFNVVVSKALDVAKSVDGSISKVVNITFSHNNFVISEFEIDQGLNQSAIEFERVAPEEIVGNEEAVLYLTRLADRLALYDPDLKKNPICEFGGLTESNLLDGAPGTGKTKTIKMFLTRLDTRAEAIKLRVTNKSLTAADVKSEWYGKSSKLLADLLKGINDPMGIATLVVDDIDLLLGQRDAEGTGGADKDLLKGLMDFFAGVGTRFIGNYTSLAATNSATAVDSALRQRFVYRLEIKGPESALDNADLIALQLRKPFHEGLVKVDTADYQPLSRQKARMSKFAYNKTNIKTAKQIGEFIYDLQNRNDKFTGRQIKNAMDVVIAKSGDFDIPEEWFSNPAEFMLKPYDVRVLMLKELFTPITPDMIVSSLQAQFDSEERYKTNKYVN